MTISPPPARPPTQLARPRRLVPSGPRSATVSARIARRLFRAAVGRLDVTVHRGRPDGADPRPRRPGDDGAPARRVLRPARPRRADRLRRGLPDRRLDTDAEDLGGFLTVLAAEIATWSRPLQRLRVVVVTRTAPAASGAAPRTTRGQHRAPLRPLQRPVRAVPRPDAELLLRARSTTSDRSAAPPARADLAAAQDRKIERLLDQAGVGEGTRVLEIGTGWGELAIRAARRGATVHSITLSVEQLALAEQRIAAAGFADRVEVELLRLPRTSARPARRTTPWCRSR